MTFLSSYGGVSDIPALTFISTFHVCGGWNARRLDCRSVRTGKRVFRNCQSSKVRECRPWRIQGIAVCGPEAFARVSRTERSLPLASTHDGNPISNTCISGLFVEPSMATQCDGALMPSMIDTFIFEAVFDTIHLQQFYNVSSMFGYYKGKLYPPTWVALCDGT